jgi:hypothetical protein
MDVTHFDVMEDVQEKGTCNCIGVENCEELFCHFPLVLESVLYLVAHLCSDS